MTFTDDVSFLLNTESKSTSYQHFVFAGVTVLREIKCRPVALTYQFTLLGFILILEVSTNVSHYF